jgi:hypothetical protein
MIYCSEKGDADPKQTVATKVKVGYQALVRLSPKI